MKNKILFSVFVLLLSLEFVCARENSGFWELKANAGLNIGGSSPTSMPVEIRKVERYTPALAPHIAFEATRFLNDKWGVSAQLALDYKAFTVKDSVSNLHTEMDMGGEEYVGYFTGHNQTEVKNLYLSLPILATCQISEKWLLQGGVYLGYLLDPGFKGTASDGYIRKDTPVGEKTKVTTATFDFSSEETRLDYGLQFAASWKFSEQFSLMGQLSWGLNSLFPSDFTGIAFDMYNIYGILAVSYSLGRH